MQEFGYYWVVHFRPLLPCTLPAVNDWYIIARKVTRETSARTLYYWSAANTPTLTQEWIAQFEIPNQEFFEGSHWPTVDATEQTAAAIDTFFQQA